MFGKKQLERMPMRKLWDHAIDVKEGFMPQKGKVYPLSREEREEVREFVKEQLRKVSRSLTVDFILFSLFIFYFLFLLIFYF